MASTFLDQASDNNVAEIMDEDPLYSIYVWFYW
jgi:hypothetical protein